MRVRICSNAISPDVFRLRAVALIVAVASVLGGASPMPASAVVTTGFRSNAHLAVGANASVAGDASKARVARSTDGQRNDASRSPSPSFQARSFSFARLPLTSRYAPHNMRGYLSH